MIQIIKYGLNGYKLLSAEFDHGTTKAQNVDANTLTDPGLYVVNNGTNLPTNNEWSVLRVSYALDKYTIIQEWFDSHGYYYKHRLKWGGSWTSWI